MIKAKNFFLFFILLGVLFSPLDAYIDSDMDGVEDANDRCPNTPFSDLVDISGCTKESLVSYHHFDIILGASYSDSNYQTLKTTDTYASSLQIDYYYKDFSLQIATAAFSSQANSYSQSGFYDTFVGTAYLLHPSKSLTLRASLGALLPTYASSLNNNKTDYTGSLNLSYALENLTLFGGYSYTQINDQDYVDANSSILYHNTNALNAGIGYNLSNTLYMSLSYNTSESIYLGINDIQTASLYGYYTLDSHWFSTFTYARGLSDSASENYLSLRLGYFF